ncbi:membrane transport protein-domain-containing protein [Stachybotrys elegans]|uniref:Membrane transport protein-domain-containing protein n=1 Tax=Stachybotrys elegans TaxID=80388 RepID=A0A8K0SN40_9HYPO|nr:membrane transport protein-domain-containing protein [Stachybotrys elegans]
MASYIGASVTAPTSFRLSQLADAAYDTQFRVFQNAHESHPDLAHLVLLVFEAVLEVVCVSLPGYIVARLGHFDADKQKFLANLNVMLFTPCLIFTKLASQLSADKLSDLAIIPAIFIVQTMVSWVVATLVSKAFRFNKRASNFVTAMGVFGNSNSLPISLVISLSQTLKGLHWDRIPGDNDDEVAARGILYLLIFQQLGQLVRWSWGYHVLLAPKDKYPEYQQHLIEEGQYRDDPQHDEAERSPLIEGLDGDTEDDYEDRSDSEAYIPAGRTPIGGTSRVSLADAGDDDILPKKRLAKNPTALGGNHPVLNGADSHILSFPSIRPVDEVDTPPETGVIARSRRSISNKAVAVKTRIAEAFTRFYQGLPKPAQSLLCGIKKVGSKANNFIWEFMNPPLWAMLLAVLVASVPALQSLFFEEGSFVKNSVTSAIKSNGGVAVPLILVVLGANLARNTMAKDDEHDPEEEVIGTKLLIASLISRMVLPTCIMAPILALMAKYLPISILDDPIFVIVCFLLTGAPSALQLAQICQLNAVYEKTMGRILFQSYVIWILPSTLVLVMMALEVVEWATQA